MTLLKRVFKYLTYKMAFVLYLKEGNLSLKIHTSLEIVKSPVHLYKKGEMNVL